MRVYTTVRKGARTWQNLGLEREITFNDNTTIYASYLFFRRKDALKYLEASPHKEYYEVVGMTIDKPKSKADSKDVIFKEVEK